MKTKNIKCPKCGFSSGDDWFQCGGKCPMPMSPHYNKKHIRNKVSPEEIWIHQSTGTIAYVKGNLGRFYWNERLEESFWGLFRKENLEWVKVGDV